MIEKTLKAKITVKWKDRVPRFAFNQFSIPKKSEYVIHAKITANTPIVLCTTPTIPVRILLARINEFTYCLNNWVFVYSFYVLLVNFISLYFVYNFFLKVSNISIFLSQSYAAVMIFTP